MILGRYTLPNLVTGIGATLALLGAVLAGQGNLPAAMVCLLYAGVGDSLDGPLARRLHTLPEDKQFGAQLDTLADLISFGIAPVLISYAAGLTNVLDLVLLLAYLACAMLRLCHFTVHGTERLAGITYFRGMPTTYAAFIFPLALAVATFIPAEALPVVLRFTHVIVAALFILNIPVRDIRSYRGLVPIGVVVITLFWLSVLIRS
jgi:CDP-diacylglycerol--serine O-phosphatidyltransferase